MVTAIRTALRGLVTLGMLAQAWNEAAHQAIGWTAMSNISGRLHTALMKTLDGEDAGDVAAFTSEVDAEYKWVHKLHFLGEDAPRDCPAGDGAASEIADYSCENSQCLIPALHRLYSAVTQQITGVADAGTEGKYAPLIAGDVGSSAADLTLGDNVRLLIGLLGDLHMPLHMTSPPGFGSEVQTDGYAPDKDGVAVPLIEAIEDKLVTHMSDSSAWWSGWTRVSSLPGPEVNKEEKDFAELGAAAMFARWAKENRQILCDTVVGTIFAKELGPRAETDGAVNLTMTGSQRYQLKEVVQKRILWAGVRVSIVLRALMSAVPANKGGLRGGGTALGHAETEISTAELDEADGAAAAGTPIPSPSKRTKGSGGFFLNLVVVVLVACAFLVVYKIGGMRVGSRPDAKNI